MDPNSKSSPGPRVKSQRRSHSAFHPDDDDFTLLKHFGDKDWVGIPPMHHETWLKIGHDEWVRGPDGRRGCHNPVSDHYESSAIADGKKLDNYVPVETPDNIPIKREQEGMSELPRDMNDNGTQEQLESPGKMKKDMPPHLLPFTPYIEKITIESPEANCWEKEDIIRIKTIRDWLDACERVHGKLCGHARQSETSSWRRPLYLIDVRDGCLVPAPLDASYVALSYIWGNKAAAASTTSKNIETLRKKGGLYQDKAMLPRVITEVIELMNGLGERYLWVDRYCIVQDDGTAKECQLRAMGSIYANAYFTLVAAQHEDAIDGLYGTRKLDVNHSQDTRRKTNMGTPAKEALLAQAMHLMRSKWYSRGWTFQEYLLSGRRVVFHNDTINWECLYSTWHELQDISTLVEQSERPAEQGDPNCVCKYASSTGFEFESSPWPNMFRYARLVSMFNRRNLTYPEDVFDAFVGILTHLSRSFPGGFICGLPQMCFDAALLWQPWTHMSRRKALRLTPSEAILPSWSWAGWAGNVNSESWRSATNYMLESDDEANAGQQCSWKTFSTVDWLYSDTLKSPLHKIRIPPEFAHPEFNHDHNPLPRGWSKELRPNTQDGDLYHHTCQPSQPFRYPIPIRDPYKAHVPPKSPRYLHATTTQAFLTLGALYRSTAADTPAADLLTSTGTWAGVLRTMSDPSGTHRKGAVVELIELSRGSVENQPIEEKSFDEWNRPGCPRVGGLYEFVNVMWIEWLDGVAYRKAVGRVEKAVWEGVAGERIDVTIG